MRGLPAGWAGGASQIPYSRRRGLAAGPVTRHFCARWATIMAQLAEIGEHLLAAAIAAPYLERDEEHALALRWKNQADEAAMHRLARAHMRLVIALAVRFRPLRLVACRPDPGGPRRAPGSCRAVRTGPRRAFFDLCDVVDPRLDAKLRFA